MNETQPRELAHVIGLFEEHGGQWLANRFAQGLLEDDVFRPFMRELAFSPFERVKRYGVLRDAKHPHRDNCSKPPHCVLYDSSHATPDSSQGAHRQAIGAIEDAFGVMKRSYPRARLEYVVHVGMCSQCGTRQTSIGALVSLEVLGRKLSLEYAVSK